ncbi:adenylate/guanylate cyclase domain-containing protein [Thalassospira sp.]|uniref:adenylate/guanylate cyclase domain-containing protein n=1 Tax=Thalassospira sp. TaxID=1912094 RepID=UPI000C46405C|nr:adenylate/guanylate cyclase domain-containing protein [Thalassospira sp.]MBC06630.1 adenylate/guanylate cyclase domain-containing protein [Thalassospira sp.]|tara:strand:- start:297 stop:2138 length:1842 start_codon:yes stop_codon:yes gene_type:complete
MNQVTARNQVSYEVYVKDRSGRWQIHGHFTGAQKKQAEEEAKQIERANHVTGVKVIREVYNNATNSSDEYVIYETRGQGKLENTNPKAQPKRSSQAKAQAQTQRPGPAPAPMMPRADASDDKPSEASPATIKKPAARSSGSVAESQTLVGLGLKMAMAFCVAIAIGLATMLVTAKGLEFLPDMGVKISQSFYDKINFLSFTVGFLASVVPMLMALTKKFKGRARKSSASSASPARGRGTRSGRGTAPGQSAGSDARRKSAAEMAAEMAREESGEAADDVPEEQDITEEAPEAKAPEPIDDTPEKPMVETREMRATREQMRDFITGSIQAIQRSVPSLDAYHKFGVNLYVAGACDACSEKHALDQKDGRMILRDCISALGANKSMADTFCKNVDDYILEPKYKDMYGAGRQSMDDYIKNEKSITTSVSKAIADWSDKPAGGPQGAAGKKLHALMFTDIVNSTAKTQELGDHGAQQMVHIHNQIVRTALINNYGKEVKHMGDGIMAVFPSSASSVEAAIEIQKNMASHNASQDLKFQIRIGINAGEAIAEENDLFGSVVQLAARVCAQAGGDETLVSDNVKNTYSGSRATFVSQGTRQMKGFSEPIEVFQVQART